MRKLILLLVPALIAVAGCNSKIEGETAAPPPAGGPKASAKHPPGESPAVINQESK